jgi:hypothetical protein
LFQPLTEEFTERAAGACQNCGAAEKLSFSSSVFGIVLPEDRPTDLGERPVPAYEDEIFMVGDRDSCN